MAIYDVDKLDGHYRWAAMTAANIASEIPNMSDPRSGTRTLDIQLLVNGREASFLPFIDRMFAQIQYMAEREAMAIFEAKFSRLHTLINELKEGLDTEF